MNKKAVFLGYLSDIYGWIFFTLGIIFWVFIFVLTKGSIESEISSIPYTSDDTVLISYLKTPASQKIILDEIFDAYKYDDKDGLFIALNTSLNSVYGRAKPVCWKLWYYQADRKELIAGESCGETLELFDKELVVPLPYNLDEKNIKMRLTVPGYK